MNEVNSQEDRFLTRAIQWTAGLGILATLLLLIFQRYGGALGFAVGLLTYLSIIIFYRRVAERFARPGVPRNVLQRALLLLGAARYPILLLITYLVVKQGMEATIGFLIGVSLMMPVLVGMAIGGWRAWDKEKGG